MAREKTIAPTAHPDDLASVEAMLAHFGQLEAQLQQVREGLVHSHRLATLGTIASIIAHEYNNILTPVVSYAQLALAAPDDAALMRKAVEKALAGAERAASISSSLLGFAREADEKHVAPLKQTIADAVNCLAREPKKDGITLTIDVPDVLVAIPPLALEQVLVNLLLNAKQAMAGGGGTLRIHATLHAGMVQLSVTDNGPGIPQALLPRLFEPFVTQRQPEALAASGKGTGLGLCICRDLVRNAGGTIRVESKPGQGATFHVELPQADDLFALPGR